MPLQVPAGLSRLLLATLGIGSGPSPCLETPLPLTGRPLCGNWVLDLTLSEALEGCLLSFCTKGQFIPMWRLVNSSSWKLTSVTVWGTITPWGP